MVHATSYVAAIIRRDVRALQLERPVVLPRKHAVGRRLARIGSSGHAAIAGSRVRCRRMSMQKGQPIGCGSALLTR